MPTDSVLTAVALAFFWALFKAIEYLVTRKKNNKWGKEQEKKLNEIHEILVKRVSDHKKFMSSLEKVLDNIEEKVNHLDTMHSVYDENLVPRWYVPTDMVKLVRQIHNSLESVNKELEENFGDVRDGQSVLVERVIDLITSQKLMVERLGDLINKLNRISNN
jgi:hypothetical protein